MLTSSCSRTLSEGLPLLCPLYCYPWFAFQVFLFQMCKMLTYLPTRMWLSSCPEGDHWRPASLFFDFKSTNTLLCLCCYLPTKKSLWEEPSSTIKIACKMNPATKKQRLCATSRLRKSRSFSPIKLTCWLTILKGAFEVNFCQLEIVIMVAGMLLACCKNWGKSWWFGASPVCNGVVRSLKQYQLLPR